MENNVYKNQCIDVPIHQVLLAKLNWIRGKKNEKCPITQL
jgi:hypothetical protein